MYKYAYNPQTKDIFSTRDNLFKNHNFFVKIFGENYREKNTVMGSKEYDGK